MNLEALSGIGTIVVMVAFISITVWAYSGKRKKDFDEAAQLPFADEPDQPEHSEERK